MSGPRQRIPNTGRSNYTDVGSNTIGNSDYSVSSSTRMKLNDSIAVFKPFTPEIPHKHKTFPPILENSRYPTLPTYEVERKSRPLSCPQKWIVANQNPGLFERSSLNSKITDEAKEAYCKEFIERNQNQLWKYDLSYIEKTPRTVYHELMIDKDFRHRAARFHDLERRFNVSGSDQVNEVLIDRLKSAVDRRQLNTFDPFASTVTTSRNDRDMRIKTMLAPSLLQHGTTHQRGFDHAPEYGNFSKYNAVLKVNQDAALKR